MEDFLYAYNQPKKFGKYDLFLDGKITANEIVYKHITKYEDGSKEIENIKLDDKIVELENRLETHFTFDNSYSTFQELEIAFANRKLKDTVIYIVKNENTSDNPDNNDMFNEYMIVGGKLELIGSGSYAKQQADLDAEVKRATEAEKVLTDNLAQEITDRTDGDAALNTKIEAETKRATEKEASIDAELAKRVPYTLYKSVDVVGNVKDVVKLDVPESSNEAMYCPQGLIMGGSAQAAGLVTRGICGVSTPTDNGHCDKENLYINYDGNTTYRNNRQLILQAGEVGVDYGHNLYQFAAARGDAVKGYVDEKIENRVVINDPITITKGDNTTSITSDTISTTTLTGTLDAESMKNSLTAEAIQNVVPIAWEGSGKAKIGEGSNGLAVGKNAFASTNATAIGNEAEAFTRAISVGFNAKTENGTYYEVVVGAGATAKNHCSLTLGSAFAETIDDKYVEHFTTTEGTGSITIGAGANTLNNGDIESSNSVTIGCKAENKGADSVVIGAYANNPQSASVVIGGGARSNGNRTVAVGQDSIVAPKSVAVGYYARAHQDFSLALGSNSDAAANNTIVIGYGATVTNTGDTQSENTTVIGYGATASAPNAVVLGAGASNSRENSVVIGVGAKALDTLATIVGCNATATTNASAMGYRANASFHSIAIGHYAQAKSVGGIAIGNNSNADKHALSIGSSAQSTSHNAIAIGTNAKANDIGATVIRSTAEDNTITQLYFSGQNTPLALKYYPTEWEKKQDVDEQGNPKVDDEGNPVMIDDKDKPTKGQAMMGYVVSKVITNDEGNQETKVLECGTNLLAALFPNHGLGDNPFQPTTTAIDDEERVTFHPSDLDLPIEEPSDNNDVEINIPTIETPIEEEYKPLPIYPIVEPTIDEITE